MTTLTVYARAHIRKSDDAYKFRIVQSIALDDLNGWAPTSSTAQGAGRVEFDPRQYPGGTKFYFCGWIRQTGAGETVHVELWDDTNGASLGEITTTATSLEYNVVEITRWTNESRTLTPRFWRSNNGGTVQMYNAFLLIVVPTDRDFLSLWSSQYWMCFGQESISSTDYDDEESQGLGRFYYDSSKFKGTTTIRFQATFSFGDSDTAYARLYNLTDESEVSGSEVSHTASSGTFSELSDPITLVTGKEYIVQIKSDNEDCYLRQSNLIIDQEDVAGDGSINQVRSYEKIVKSGATSGTTWIESAYNALSTRPDPYTWQLVTRESFLQAFMKVAGASDGGSIAVKDEDEGIYTIIGGILEEQPLTISFQRFTTRVHRFPVTSVKFNALSYIRERHAGGASDLFSFSAFYIITDSYLNGSSARYVQVKANIFATTPRPITAKARILKHDVVLTTYYFDASDAGPNDPDTAWADDANAFNGETENYASCSTRRVGDDNGLNATGTNAPASHEKSAIQLVKMRFYMQTPEGTFDYLDWKVESGAEHLITTFGTFIDSYYTSSTDALWTPYYLIEDPADGWTWAKIQALKITLWNDNWNDAEDRVFKVEILVYHNTPTPQTIQAKGRVASYSFPATAQSSAIKTLAGDLQFATATLTAVDSIPANTSITYYLSADGGNNWEEVTDEVEHSFVDKGTDLRWKAILTTTDSKVTPYIETVSVDWTTESAAAAEQTITAKGRIQKQFTQTITAKGRIQIVTTQTISAKSRIQKDRTETITTKGRIQIGLTQTITAKANIKVTSTQTIEAKASLMREFSQTISAKARIGISSSQTVTAKARIKKQFNQTITTKGRIQISGLQTITAKALIKKETSQTITAKGVITKSFSQTIEAKGRIQITFTQTITAKGRITIASSQTITAKGRITALQTQTITAKVSIKKLSTQTISAKGSIKREFEQTISAKARIGLLTTKTITAKSRITKEFTQTITAKGNIKATQDQTIEAKAAIKLTTTQTISAKTAIQRTLTQTLTAKGRITISGSQTLTAKGRIQKQFSQSIQAKGRITISSTQAISAKASLEKPTYQYISAKGRIEVQSQQTITAKGRITISSERTITSKGDIKKQTTQTIEAKGRIQLAGIGVTIDAKARIEKEESRTISAKGAISRTFEQTISAKGKIQKIFTQTLSAKGRIRATTSQTIQALASIKRLAVTRTIQAKGRIQIATSQSIQAIGRIQQARTQTIGALGRIKKQFSQTIEAKGRIGVFGGKTIDSKANIRTSISQTINAKGRITDVGTQTIEAKGRITILGSQTIQAKASIQKTSSRTIEAVGRIETISTQTLSAKGRIQRQSSQTISAKGYIEIVSEKTISAKGRIERSQEQTVNAKGRIGIVSQQTIDAKANITTTITQTISALARICRGQTIEAKANIKAVATQSISAKGNILLTQEKTIQTKASILKLFAKTIQAKGYIITWEVIDIIDQVRDQKIVDEVTYVKEITREISYTKVETVNIVDERSQVKDLPRTRPRVIEITDLSRTQQIKWITAKARIRS